MGGAFLFLSFALSFVISLVRIISLGFATPMIGRFSPSRMMYRMKNQPRYVTRQVHKIG